MKILHNKFIKILVYIIPTILMIVFIISFINVKSELNQLKIRYKNNIEKYTKEKNRLIENYREKKNRLI